GPSRVLLGFPLETDRLLGHALLGEEADDRELRPRGGRRGRRRRSDGRSGCEQQPDEHRSDRAGGEVVAAVAAGESSHPHFVNAAFAGACLDFWLPGIDLDLMEGRVRRYSSAVLITTSSPAADGAAGVSTTGAPPSFGSGAESSNSFRKWLR